MTLMKSRRLIGFPRGTEQSIVAGQPGTQGVQAQAAAPVIPDELADAGYRPIPSRSAGPAEHAR